jgi:hypothetical protein
MKEYLKKYSDYNPEKFNREFIMSRNDKDILDYVKDIFKALEILNEIEVIDVRLETDEASFGPIKNQHQYYKAIMPSRLNKIHYKVKITPTEMPANKQLLNEEGEEEVEVVEGDSSAGLTATSNSFIIERDLFINKVIENSFYINEGIRYFLIYQIVDNSTYGTKDSVSLKSLLMPITVNRRDNISLDSFFDSTQSYHEKFPSYDIILFSKRISPILYVMSKYAFNSLVKMNVKDDTRLIEERQQHVDTSLIASFNKFFGVNIKFSDDPEKLMDSGRTVFKLSDKKSQDKGTYISVETAKLKSNDQNLMAILGSLADIKADKKKRITFTYNDFVSPWFWIDKLSTFFTKNSDPIKKFEKIKTMLISLDRLMDDATRKILKLDSDDKRNTLNVIRYMLRNFERLSTDDNQDLENKRVRIYEYMLYPLRKYFSDHIYRVLNSPTRSANILQRIFSNLNPMYIIKQTVVNELLRYYNSTNEMNLYSCLLKYTFRGPQSINKTVSVYQRDLHPSYAGRLSLVASSASDPGISGTLVPFVELDGQYFGTQKKEEGK